MAVGEYEYKAYGPVRLEPDVSEEYIASIFMVEK
jgi:hypothetical protein